MIYKRKKYILFLINPNEKNWTLIY